MNACVCFTAYKEYSSVLACVLLRVGQNHVFIGIYGVHIGFVSKESSYIRSYTVQCTVLANPSTAYGEYSSVLA